MNITKSRLHFSIACVIGLCLLIGVAGSAFASGAKESTKPSSEAMKPVELRISWWGGASRHEKWNAVLDKFQQKNPHITIKREFTDYNGYWDKLATQAAGGNAPDVIMQVMHKFAEYAIRGQLMELDELIASKKINLSDWSQPIIDSGKLKGKVYMVSYGNTTNAMLYNATMFEQIGVKPPSLTWTWQDFVEKAKEIQGKLSQGVWAIEDLGGYDYLFSNWCLSRGKNYYTEGGKLGIDKQDMLDYLTLWDVLRKTKATPPANVQAEYPSERPAQTMLAQGKVSMFVRPVNQLTAFQTGTKDMLGLATVPSDKRSGQDLGGAYISLYSKTQHPEEALMLLNYLISDTDAASIMKLEYGPMGSKRMNEFLTPLLPKAEQAAINFMQSVGSLINVPVQPPAGANEISQQFRLANEAVAFGKKNIKQAVDDFFMEAEKILK